MSAPLHVLVTVGTDLHPFDRLVRWMDEWAAAHPADKVVIQYGNSEAPSVAEGHHLLPGAVLSELFHTVDVVIAAGGPGGLLEARAAGRLPIAVPRRNAFGEHVDDHQVAFVRHLGRSGLVHAAEDREDLLALLDGAAADRSPFRCDPVPLGEAPGVRRTGELIDELVSRPRRGGLSGRFRR